MPFTRWEGGMESLVAEAEQWLPPLPKDAAAVERWMHDAPQLAARMLATSPARHAVISAEADADVLLAKAVCLKDAGNRNVSERRFTDAVAQYTDALRCFRGDPARARPSLLATLLANRSAARMGNSDAAGAAGDAALAVVADPTYAKAWYRLAAALQRCPTAAPVEALLTTATHMAMQLASNAAAAPEAVDVRTVVTQAKAVLAEMARGGQHSHSLCAGRAEVHKEVEVREVAGKGRGLVVLECVSPGDTIACEVRAAIASAGSARSPPGECRWRSWRSRCPPLAKHYVHLARASLPS